MISVIIFRMGDNSSGRLISFLLEGEDVISCEVCLEPFQPTHLLSSTEILENVQRGREVNVTIIHVPDSITGGKGSEKTRITPKCKILAEKSTEARHQRCMDCSRKIPSKLVAKSSRYCEACSSEEIMNLLTVTLSSLDDSIRKIEISGTLPPALLSDLRNQQIQNYSKMTKMNTYLEKSSQGYKKDPVRKTMHSGLSSSTSAIRQSRLTLRSDDSLARESLCSLVSILPDSPFIRSLSEIINRISSKDTVEERKELFHSCVNIITQILYGYIMLISFLLLNHCFILNVLSRKRVQPTGGKRSKRQDIWKSIQFAYMEILKIAAKVNHRQNNTQLNLLRIIFTFYQNYPAYHPERVDLLDDLAYLCHLYADVCDEATVTICMIEAARARAAEGSLSEEDKANTNERLNVCACQCYLPSNYRFHGLFIFIHTVFAFLQLIDDHLLECRRQQKLQELRTTKTKKDSKFKKIWKSCFQMQRVLV
uniref:RB_A domain-containing protein n=1 Tax=Heterorhabditis bacteriophora TaxID=37862 RepID=A0A1I7WMV7_HETBA